MSIIINNASAPSVTTENNITYTDIYFDLTENSIPDSKTLFSEITKTDLRVSSDEAAVLNSIRNIFQTTPGEKVLNPTFGINLTQWLFEPANEFTAREIGEAIVSGIERYEPRVVVNNVAVVADIDNNQYRIKLALLLPQLNISREYPAILGPGFDFITENE